VGNFNLIMRGAAPRRAASEDGAKKRIECRPAFVFTVTQQYEADCNFVGLALPKAGYPKAKLSNLNKIVCSPGCYS
jgi:hypothetical protein